MCRCGNFRNCLGTCCWFLGQKRAIPPVFNIVWTCVLIVRNFTSVLTTGAKKCSTNFSEDLLQTMVKPRRSHNKLEKEIMKRNRHIKPYHNGKNRRTGRKSSARRNNKGPAKANSEHAEKIRIKWIAAKQEEQQRKASEKAESAAGPCCASEAALNATNLRLLRELQSTVCDRVWNDLLGRWEGVIPRAFVRKNAVHMHHFREFARENGYRNR